MRIPDIIKNLFRIPYFYRAEITHNSRVIGASETFDAAKYTATSVTFTIPENTGSINYDTVRIMGVELFPGSSRSFKTEIPHLDKTKYTIVFLGVAGTQPVLYAYTTSVSKYTAIQPDDIQPCDKV